MIDPSDLKYMTTERFLEMYKQIDAAIRDLQNDQQLLITAYTTDYNMTSPEVAEYLRCSTQAIPRDIPCNHIGRDYLYKRSDVDAWLKAHQRTRK